MRSAIDAALEQLSLRDRQILREFYLEEKNKHEICRDAGLTDAQLRLIVFRAKERFRRIFPDNLKQSGSVDALRH